MDYNKFDKKGTPSLVSTAVFYRYRAAHHSPSAGCWKLTYAYPSDLLVTTSRQTRMDSTGPAWLNFSKSCASVTSE